MPKKKKPQDDVQPKQSGNAKSLKDLDKEISFFLTYYVDYIITVNTASGVDIF